MAEFWQAYGNVIIFAAFFILMMGHHLFMGHGGHGTRGGRGGHAHGSGDEADAPDDGRRRQSGGCH